MKLAIWNIRNPITCDSAEKFIAYVCAIDSKCTMLRKKKVDIQLQNEFDSIKPVNVQLMVIGITNLVGNREWKMVYLVIEI